MSASARLLKPPVRERKSPARPEPEAATGKKSKKELSYRGICITCGERIEIEAENLGVSFFAFCNPECKAKFEQEMNEDLD